MSENETDPQISEENQDQQNEEQSNEPSVTKEAQAAPSQKKPAAAAKAPEKNKKQKPVKGDKDELSGLGVVNIRNEFYRDGYRSLLKLVVMQGLVILGLIFAVYAAINSKQPADKFFATTEDGRLIPMVALDEPNLNTPALMSWAAQACTEVMTFGFSDYRRRLQESSQNFTRRGWDSFMQALQRSRIVEMVEANQQIITAAPRGAPFVINEGTVAGRYQWVVQIPLILTYQSAERQRSDRLTVRVVIVRVPRLESSNGVGIEQWIATPG